MSWKSKMILVNLMTKTGNSLMKATQIVIYLSKKILYLLTVLGLYTTNNIIIVLVNYCFSIFSLWYELEIWNNFLS